MEDVITVVSGLPRSGTSLMMKMLDAGGVPPLVDGIREADEDNPKGYFELEKVKKLAEDSSWLPEARGKVIKVISQLLYDLPTGYDFRVIFMRRNIDEILASQKKMLIRRGTLKDDGPSEAKMRDIMLKHVSQVLGWMDERGMKHVEVSYNEMFTSPDEHILSVNELLGGGLDTEAMARTIDPELYRNRAKK
ncbi:MAG: hypothetical protein ACYTDY_03145 [Planctomycetota bacterium]|jgi:hypothetical protein